jgi:hypothetical protein
MSIHVPAQRCALSFFMRFMFVVVKFLGEDPGGEGDARLT